MSFQVDKVLKTSLLFTQKKAGTNLYCKYVTILVKIQKKLVGLMGTGFFYVFWQKLLIFLTILVFFVVCAQICAEVEQSETEATYL